MTAAAHRRRVDAVLLDATGTLIELREPVGETYARFARERGVEIPPARLQEAFGRILRRAPPRVFPDAPRAEVAALERSWWRDVVRSCLRAADQSRPVPDFEAFFSALFGHYAGAGAWRARPGARRALDSLRGAGRRCAVVSDFDHRLPAILEALDLATALDAVVLPADTGAAKPDPAPFRRALERLETPTAAAVYVGDDPARDLAAARAAGLRAIDARVLATLDELPGLIDFIDLVDPIDAIDGLEAADAPEEDLPHG